MERYIRRTLRTLWYASTSHSTHPSIALHASTQTSLYPSHQPLPSSHPISSRIYSNTSRQSHIYRNMFAQTTSAPPSTTTYEQGLSANQQPMAGGSLRKGLERLTQVIERGVDRQILTAQMRAYDTSRFSSSSSDSMAKHRYL
jgi:hypothetical protein